MESSVCVCVCVCRLNGCIFIVSFRLCLVGIHGNTLAMLVSRIKGPLAT